MGKGCPRPCQRVPAAPPLGPAPCSGACSIYLSLALCFCSVSSCLLCLPGFVSAPGSSRHCLTDDSSGINMKVTQGNKGPAVSAVVVWRVAPRDSPTDSSAPWAPRFPAPGGCTLKGLVLMPFGSELPLATESAPSAAALVMGGLSCLLHSCPRALWEQLEEDKGMGESPPTPPTSWGDLASQ